MPKNQLVTFGKATQRCTVDRAYIVILRVVNGKCTANTNHVRITRQRSFHTILANAIHDNAKFVNNGILLLYIGIMFQITAQSSRILFVCHSQVTKKTVLWNPWQRTRRFHVYQRTWHQQFTQTKRAARQSMRFALNARLSRNGGVVQIDTRALQRISRVRFSQKAPNVFARQRLYALKL
jgi:hypothetical protein